MLPIRTILYATDFSPEARPAFEVACALAREGDGRLVILHVEAPPLSTLGGTPIVPPLSPEYDREGPWERLCGVRPAGGGVAVEHRLEYGEPAPVILEVARETGADLIVIATHGRTGLRHLLTGSVAEHVVREAPCPVLTIRSAAGSELARSPAVEEMVPG